MKVYSEIINEAKKQFPSNEAIISGASKCKDRYLTLLNAYQSSKHENFESFDHIIKDVTNIGPLQFIEKYGTNTEEARLDKELQSYIFIVEQNCANKEVFDISSLHQRMLAVIMQAKKEWAKMSREERILVKLHSANDNILNEIDGSALLLYDNLFETDYFRMNKKVSLEDEQIYQEGIKMSDLEFNF